MADVAEESFFASILLTLESMKVPYFVVGGVAALLYGTLRVTYDIDIVVELKSADVEDLVKSYPLPRYYADPLQVQDSIERGIPFNIIDTQNGEKADFIPTLERDSEPFSRRIRQTLKLPSGLQLGLWVASPEDVILGKLESWDVVASQKHESDIVGILVAAKQSGKTLDTSYIAEASQQYHPETLALWYELLKNAEDYT